MMERRILDWRFVAAFAFMLLVATAAWGFVERNRQTNALIAIADRTTSEYDRLSTQIEALNGQAAAAARASVAQRKALRKQNREQAARLQALLDYLRAHGIAIPQTFAPQDGGGAHPKGPGPRGPKPTHLASPGPTATPTPTDPSLTDVVCGLLAVPLICP
jgi:hypothetical protein